MKTMVVNMKLGQTYGDQLRQAAPDWHIVYTDAEQWQEHLQHAEILVNWPQEAGQVCLADDAALRWVHMWGAGVNGLPLDAFQNKGVLLTNSSGVHAFPISETIFAMILAFRRQLHLYIRNQIQHKWDSSVHPQEIHGDTIGIIGVGDIGQETARLAKAFGMKVIGLRRSAQPAEYVDVMYGMQGLSQLLEQSDYVVNTLPLTKETVHFIGGAQFDEMKPNAFYVNIGRGGTTDTEALVQALLQKRIAGAGLDVFEQEPLPDDHPLWRMDNVILTPHTSGLTQYYDQRALDIFVSNLHDYISLGVPTNNRVDLSKQY